MDTKKKIVVAILLFDEVEALDFAGPYEVFSLASKVKPEGKTFQLITVSQKGTMVTVSHGLKIVPDYSFTTMPAVNILIIPGGYGAREVEVYNSELTSWIRKISHKVQVIASVCTGAFLLAKAGLLHGKNVTTHWAAQDRLEREYPSCHVQRQVKFIDDENIITSGGIACGIEMSFYMVKKFAGLEVATSTAKRMVYDVAL